MTRKTKIASKAHGLRLCVETVTPAVASRYLTAVAPNRCILKRAVAALARDMAEHRWRLTGQGILFDENGRLIDGQHRLLACIRADTSFQTVVVRGMLAGEMAYIDGGRARSIGQRFKIEQIPNAALIAAVCRWIWQWERGLTYKYRVAGGTYAEYREILNRWPRLSSAYQQVRPVKGVMPLSMAGFIWVAIKDDLDERFAGFVAGLSEGAGLARGSPILLLRNRLLAAKASNLKLYRPVMMGLAIKAWNCHVQSASLRVLKLGPREEPEVIRSLADVGLEEVAG